MSIYEWMVSGGGMAVICLSLIQISPVKVNPWSAIARAVGRAMNGEITDRLDRTDAQNARYRILRFDDEIRHDVRHTFEHFNQIIEDIDAYEQYCEAHKEYPNNKAKSAIRNIKEIYEKCRNENTFL